MSDNNYFNEVVKSAQAFTREVVNEALRLHPVPPGMSKLSQKEQLDQYLALTPQQLQSLVQKKGAAEVNYYISKMERLRSKLGD